MKNVAGEYEAAVEIGERAVAKNPEDAAAYYQLGIAYTQLDSVDRAYRAFARATELDAGNEAMRDTAEIFIEESYAKHFVQGHVAYNQMDFERSVREFRLATKADPRRPDAYYQLGVAYLLLGKHDDLYYGRAADALDQALTHEPDKELRLEILETSGRTLSLAGRDEEAIARFHELIDTDSTRFRQVERVGTDLLKQKQWGRSIPFLELAWDARKRCDNDSFMPPYNIGVAWYGMRHEDPDAATRAIDYFQQALERKPDEPLTVLAIMRVCLYLKDWNQAIHWGERYVRIRPDDKTGWRYLAQCYTAIGDEANAEACRRRSK